MNRYLLAGLLQVDLPAHTVRLCDGGSLDWDGDTFTARDSVFGVVQGLTTISEAVGNQLPTFTLSFLPPEAVASADLIDKTFQGSRLRIWTAEVDEDTGLITGDPDLEADMIIDVPTLRWENGVRILEVDCVSAWQRLFDFNEGNFLDGPSHKRIYPSEQGLDNVTGVATTFAWGTAGPRGVR